MVGSQGSFEDGQRPAVEGPRLVEVPAGLEEHGQVVQGHGDVGMAWPEELLPHRQRPAVEPIGLGILAPRLVQHRQIVEVDGDLVVLRAELRSKIARARRYRASASSWQPCPSSRAARAATSAATSRVVGPQRPLADRHGAAGERHAAGEAAAGVLQPAEVVVDRRHLGMVGPEGPLRDRQGPAVQPPGLGEAALVLVQDPQVVQDAGDVEVIGPERSLGDGQGPAVQPLGLVVSPLDAVDRRQVTQRLSPNSLDILILARGDLPP